MRRTTAAMRGLRRPPRTRPSLSCTCTTTSLLTTPGSLCMAHRTYLHLSFPCYKQYRMKCAYEEPTMRFFCEGDDAEYRAALRRLLVTTLLPPATNNFTERGSCLPGEMPAVQPPPQQQQQLLRRLLAQRLPGAEPVVSYAQMRSTPGRVLSFYEVLATLCPGLALIAADHFTFTSLLASYAPYELIPAHTNTTNVTTNITDSKWLSDLDAGRCIGCIAQREFLREPPGLQTEAVYDLDRNYFRLRGAGKFAVVGATVADFALVTATLVLPTFLASGKEEGRRSTQCFLVPLRDATQGNILRRGITMRSLQPNTTHNMSAGCDDGSELLLLYSAGSAVLHFDEVCVPATYLLQPHGLPQAQQDKLRTVLTRHTKKKTSATSKNTTSTCEGLRWSNEMSALELLRRRSQLASIALYLGTLKRLLSHVTPCIAARHVVLPWCEEAEVKDEATAKTKKEEATKGGERQEQPQRSSSSNSSSSNRYVEPLLGVQAVQTALVPRVACAYVCMAAWQRLRRPLAQLSLSSEAAQPEGLYTGLDALHLTGLLYTLQEEIFALHDVVHRFLGVQSVLPGTFGCAAALALVHVRYTNTTCTTSNAPIRYAAGSSSNMTSNGYDRNALICDVGLQAVAHNWGTTHWGWAASNAVQLGPRLGRLLRNPFYSPSLSDLNRHYFFFGHAYYAMKRTLRRVYKSEEQQQQHRHYLTGQDASRAQKAVWYNWNTFYTRHLRFCGRTLIALYFLDSMQGAARECTDLRGRKVLRDLGWLFAVHCLAQELSLYLIMQFLSPRQGKAVLAQLDNLATVIAPQCVNLVEAMQLPRAAYCGVCAAREERKWALFWSIPGTETRLQDKEEQSSVITMEEEEKDDHSREGEEDAENDSEEKDAWDKAEKAQRSKAAEAAVKEGDEEEMDLFHGLADKPSYATRK